MNAIVNGTERNITMKRRLCILLSLFLMMSVSSPLIAHEGEEHGDTNKVKMSEGMFVLSAMTDNFEVVLKYPPSESGKETKILIYLSDYATNKPIPNAQIEIEIDSLESTKPKIEKTDLSGVYHTEIIFLENKKYNVTLTITLKDIVELIPLRGIQIGATLENAEGHSHSGESSTIVGRILLALVILIVAGGIGFVSFRLGKRKAEKIKTVSPSVSKDVPEEVEQQTAK